MENKIGHDPIVSIKSGLPEKSGCAPLVPLIMPPIVFALAALLSFLLLRVAGAPT
jgi:hypothetical protein